MFSIGLSNQYFAQAGGRQREKYSRKGSRRGNYIHKRYRSAGHADEFARGGSSRFHKYNKLFHRPKLTTWQYHSSGSIRNINKANKYLFKRYRSKGKIENDVELYRRKRSRDRNRILGSHVFRKSRHYKSR